MKTGIYAFSFLLAITSLPLLATPQQSLGDLARQLRQEQRKSGLKATKVYTNDNLLPRSPDEGRTATSGIPSPPANTSSDKAQAELDSSQADKQTSKASETGQAAGKSETPEDKINTKEYWRAKFKSARAQLADAKERQQLSEDELNLLQIQDASTLDPTLKAELAEKIKAKEDEVSQGRTATEEAQKFLEDLQTKFKHSGAPDEWSETEIETSE